MLGLRRSHVDPLRSQVLVRKQRQEVPGRGSVESDPKSEAGRRTVVLPKVAIEALEEHMAYFCSPEPDAIVFVAPQGGPLRRARLSEAWCEAKEIVGLDPRLHIHDLRHHAATLMARKPDITTKELMARIGHASPRAALRYQQATEDRDAEIASFIDEHIAKAARAPKAGLSRLPRDERAKKDVAKRSRTVGQDP
jgi:integrase